MGDSSTQLHEPAELLRPETIDRHRAFVSLIEEFDAIDWYQQRVDATDDKELAALLAHNRNEEHEHAAMTLEWIRRRDDNLDKMLRRYLFTEGSIVDLEDEIESGHGPKNDAADRAKSTSRAKSTLSADGSLGIGSLRGKT